MYTNLVPSSSWAIAQVEFYQLRGKIEDRHWWRWGGGGGKGSVQTKKLSPSHTVCNSTYYLLIENQYWKNSHRATEITLAKELPLLVQISPVGRHDLLLRLLAIKWRGRSNFEGQGFTSSCLAKKRTSSSVRVRITSLIHDFSCERWLASGKYASYLSFRSSNV